MSSLDYKPFYRQHLPHYQPPGATLFVTFRLANSLPANVLRDLDNQRREIDQKLARIDNMHSLKRHTARQANLLLGREGEFWQDESYDHVVRDEAEYRRIVTYVLNNPVKAGLVDAWRLWRWNFSRTDC